MSPNLELKKYVKKATRSDTAATKCEPLTIFEFLETTIVRPRRECKGWV